MTLNEAPRVSMPEPCAYGGAHDAKELENSLFYGIVFQGCEG